MLCLERKIGEEIVIGNITIRVLGQHWSAGKRAVRIGIKAPKNVPIVRPDAREKMPPRPAALERRP